LAFSGLFHLLGWTADVPLRLVLLRVVAASAVAAAVETLPVESWDNLTVVMAALATDLAVIKATHTKL
jgi:hypothetical protein